jgi:hypothetical protein
MPCRSVPFKKMYGLGNDFIVLDARKEPSVRAPHLPLRGQPSRACLPHTVHLPQVSLASEPKRATALTDRKTGIGCDQLIIMEVSLCARTGMCCCCNAACSAHQSTEDPCWCDRHATMPCAACASSTPTALRSGRAEMRRDALAGSSSRRTPRPTAPPSAPRLVCSSATRSVGCSASAPIYKFFPLDVCPDMLRSR